ncbi:MAG: cation:proton antiporter [Bacteroidota bacterium]
MPLAAVLPQLNEIAALLVVSVAIAYLSYRLRLVPIVGFLLAGVAIGPNALGIVRDQALVDVLAEVGVILLLFTIGIEFSLEKLSKIRRAIAIGGGLQVGVTIAAVTGGLVAAGISWQEGVYTGCLVALSTTAIVLGLLAERNETGSPTGQLALAILIFQDLAIVAMVLIVPMLGSGGGTLGDLMLVLGKAVLLIAAVVVLARRAVPKLLERVARTRRQELFLLSVVAICFGTAAGSSVMGVSLALGAFLAGLVVSESPYSGHALSEVLPLRTVFNAVFFVSVGMLLDLRFLIENPLLVVAAAAVVIVLKFAIASASVLALGFPLRIAAATGLTLAQIGEFSFVLERAGRAAGLSPMGLGDEGAQLFIAVTVLLMMATPFKIDAGPRFGSALAVRLGGKGTQPEDAGESTSSLEDHTIVVGYGPAGRHLVRAMRDTGIPFVVIELNPASMDELKAEGLPAIYGDATQQHTLEAAGLKYAKLCVIAISDPNASPRIVHLARHLNPTLQVIARTRFFTDVERLHQLGADVVVPEELETTVRLFSHVLGAYFVPPAEVDRQIAALRAEDYRVLRGSIQEAHLMVLEGLDEEGLHTRAVAVREGAPAAGRTLAELALRQTYRLTVLAVRRDGKTVGSPAGDFRPQPGDRLVLVGTATDFAESADLFRTPEDREEIVD